MDDLRDLWRRGGRLTWRRFGVLLRHLPQDSHYQTVLRDTLEVDERPVHADPVFGPWNLANYQLAALNDGVNRLLAAYAGAEMPDPAPRPGPKKRQDPVIDNAKVAYLQEIRDRHRREGGD
ncbi:MAG: hypothetical protein ACXVGC_00110 [Mycobacteriaceae bacterium]